MRNKKSLRRIIGVSLLTAMLTFGVSTINVNAESVDPPVVFKRTYQVTKTDRVINAPKALKYESVDPPVVFERR